MISIDTKNLNPKFLEQMERKLRRDHKRIIAQAAQYTKQEAQNNAPVDTGALKASIDTELLDTGFFIGSKLPYSGYVEYGTKRIRVFAFLRKAISKMILKFSSK